MKNWDKMTPAQVAAMVRVDNKRKQLCAEVEKEWKEKGKDKRKKK